MISPPPLKAGDTIGLISTARKINEEELQIGIDQLQSWGFRVQLGKNLFQSDHQFSGTDSQRLGDIQDFINNPEIKAIFCARGGYGTVRIIDNINFLPLVAHPKWICGYSDITVLHNRLSKLGIESLHCSMPINFATNTEPSLQSIYQVLTGNNPKYPVGAHPLNINGTAEGILSGGNLSVIYSQMGSSTALNTKGTILFLEDLDEYLYHIDRMMQNLNRNGYFENLAGVVIGGMNDMNDNAVPYGKTAENIIHEYFSGRNYPVCFGFPAGHLNDNRALIMGRKVRLKVEGNAILKFDGAK